MSPEEHELLKKSADLAEENNDMLRKMQRSIRLGQTMTLVYWIFIVGGAVGAYYFIQPYLNQIMSTLGSYGATTSSLNGSMSNVKSILDSLKNFTQVK